MLLLMICLEAGILNRLKRLLAMNVIKSDCGNRHLQRYLAQINSIKNKV